MPLLPKAGALPIYKYQGKRCPICDGTLFASAANNSYVTATCFSSEQLRLVRSQSTRCNLCKTSIRHNIMWLGGQKINCMSFQELEAAGVYFVSQKTCFTMAYLRLCYLRLLRAKTTPGQEAAVRFLASENHPLQFWQEHSLRDHLLHALEGYAIAQETPDKVVDYNLDYPAKHCVRFTGARNRVTLFPPASNITSVSFDGNFGLHRRLLPEVEPARTVRRKGHPRKLLHECVRSCACRQKDATRVVLPDRTAGWQFAVDPVSRAVLGACEHPVNERTTDKVELLQSVLSMPNMQVDLLIHDDACHFENYVRKNQTEGFEGIKFYIIDEFHRRNHKCSKRVLTRREKARVQHVRTNTSEMFNAWVRPLNFFVNGLRPHSHKFWVLEACKFFNRHVSKKPTILTRRTNVRSRQILKRPRAFVRRRPASST